MCALQGEEQVQGVRWGQHLCARQAEERLQGVRWGQHLCARQAEEPLQGVRWGQHLCARQAQERLQGVRGYQGWLGCCRARYRCLQSRSRPALRLSSRRIARARRLDLGGRLATRSCEAHSARRRSSGPSVLLVPLCHLSGRVGIHLHITLPRLACALGHDPHCPLPTCMAARGAPGPDCPWG